MQIFFKLFFSFFVVSVCLFVTYPAFAASIRVVTPEGPVKVGEEFFVPIILDTQGESVNAIEGNLAFPHSLLEIVDIESGDSIINFWIEKPQRQGAEKIIFSGITPGGFVGAKQNIFTVVFRAKELGLGNIHGSKFQVLRHDGMGTALPLEINTAWVQVNTSTSDNFFVQPQREDREIPENFNPFIIQDQHLFFGKYTLIFSSQDKGSGIDHYEVKEGKTANYEVVESPYMLKNQALDTDIFIKAVDNFGNERIIVIEGENKISWYENYKKFGIIGTLLLFVGALFFIVWLKYFHKS